MLFSSSSCRVASSSRWRRYCLYATMRVLRRCSFFAKTYDGHITFRGRHTIDISAAFGSRRLILMIRIFINIDDVSYALIFARRAALRFIFLPPCLWSGLSAVFFAMPFFLSLPSLIDCSLLMRFLRRSIFTAPCQASIVYEVICRFDRRALAMATPRHWCFSSSFFLSSFLSLRHTLYIMIPLLLRHIYYH